MLLLLVQTQDATHRGGSLDSAFDERRHVDEWLRH